MSRIVRIAVIDSGVHASHPHVGGVAGGIGIDERGDAHGDYVDRLGHGTAVIAAIREKAPASEIYAIKVFDRELASTGVALVAACDQAIACGAAVINMSLGTTNRDHEPAFVEALARIRASGAVLIAAGSDGEVRWLPGSLPGAWQVSLDWTIPRDRCRVDRLSAGGAMFRASGYPRPIPGVPPERNLKGLSFAVANVTGIVAALLAGDPAGDATSVVMRAFERRRPDPSSLP
jgi:subtilisin family serine protease